MKAQARKILALIMAMVMSLSLAAPAFATEAEEAPAESSAPAAVEVEAPETEEKEEAGELDTQAEKIVVDGIEEIITNNISEGYRITLKQGSAAAPDSPVEKKWTDADSAYATVTTAPYGKNLIGVPKMVVKTVKATADYTLSGSDPVVKDFVIVDPDGSVFKPSDASINWTALGEKVNWIATLDQNGKEVRRRVKGWMYQETQLDGSVIVYFKLTPVDKQNNTQFQTNVKDDEWKYFAAATTTAGKVTKAKYDKALTRDDDIREALENAVLLDENGNGFATGSYNVLQVPAPGVTLALADPDTDVDRVDYDFGVENIVGLTVSGGSGLRVVFQDSQSNKTVSGTFDVRVVKKTTFKDPKKDAETVVMTNADEIKNLVATALGSSVRVDSVTAASGEWFTVSVTDLSAYATMTPDLNPDQYKSNVVAYTVGTKTDIAGLENLTADGFYNAEDDKGKNATNVAANTKVYGPVAVKASDVETKDFLFTVEDWNGSGKSGVVTMKQLNNAVDDYKEHVKNSQPTTASEDAAFEFAGLHVSIDKKFYFFESLAEMQSIVHNRYCIADITVPYFTLVMNTKKGETENKQVEAQTIYGSPDYTSYKAKAGWYTDANVAANKDFVETKQNVFVKSSAHKLAKVVDSVAPTCKKPGSKTTRVICLVDGQEFSSKTETIDRVLTNVTKLSKTDGYVLKDSYDDFGKIPDGLQKYYSYNDSSKKYERLSNADLTKNDLHAITKVEITTTNATKDKAGVKTTTYTCNLGEVHDDLTVVEEITKVGLQHAGTWTYSAWGTQNTNDVRNPANLYGYTPIVADVDVDDATLPINATGAEFFKFTKAEAQPDGTYVSGVATYSNIQVWKNTNGVKTYNNKSYSAIAIVKNITKGAKDCQDGAATIEVNVYEVSNTAVDILPGADHVEKSVANKLATLVATYTQPVVVPAEKTHVDANNDGKCDNCEAEINQTTPDNENTVDISKAVVKFDALTYTGKVAQPSVTVTLDGVPLAKGIDYEVEEMQDVDAGTYYLIVAGKGDFSGRTAGKVTINQAKQPMTVKATAPSAKKLKKKAQKVALTIKNAQGKVTVKVSGPATVKGTTVTAKKGTKKNKKIKITVTAAGNDNYKSGSKTVTVKVKA